MDVYGPKCFCKKHEHFHLVEESCPYCVEDNTPAREDPASKVNREEMERMLQWWVLT